MAKRRSSKTVETPVRIACRFGSALLFGLLSCASATAAPNQPAFYGTIPQIVFTPIRMNKTFSVPLSPLLFLTAMVDKCTETFPSNPPKIMNNWTDPFGLSELWLSSSMTLSSFGKCLRQLFLVRLLMFSSSLSSSCLS